MTLVAIIILGVMFMAVGLFAGALIYLKLSENNRVSPI